MFQIFVSQFVQTMASSSTCVVLRPVISMYSSNPLQSSLVGEYLLQATVAFVLLPNVTGDNSTAQSSKPMEVVHVGDRGGRCTSRSVQATLTAPHPTSPVSTINLSDVLMRFCGMVLPHSIGRVHCFAPSVCRPRSNVAHTLMGHHSIGQFWSSSTGQQVMPYPIFLV